MERIIFKVLTRKELQSNLDNAIKNIAELEPKESRLTPFGRYRLEHAYHVRTKIKSILDTFPDKQEFMFLDDNVVTMEYNVLMKLPGIWNPGTQNQDNNE